MVSRAFQECFRKFQRGPGACHRFLMSFVSVPFGFKFHGVPYCLREYSMGFREHFMMFHEVLEALYRLSMGLHGYFRGVSGCSSVLLKLQGCYTGF